MSEENQVFINLRLKIKKKDQEIEDLKENKEYWKGRASLLGWEVYRLRAAQKKENTNSGNNNCLGDKLVVSENSPVSKSVKYNNDGNRERKKLVANRSQTNNDVNGERPNVEAKRRRDNIDGDMKRTKIVAKGRHDIYEEDRGRISVVAKISQDNYDGGSDRDGSKIVAKIRHNYDDNREGTQVVTKSSNTMLLGNEMSNNSRGQVDESLCIEANFINRRYPAVYRERMYAVEKTDNIDEEHNSDIEEDCPYQLWNCRKCPKTFRFAAGLAIHLEVHYPGKNPVVSCPLNDQYTGTVEKMTEHLRSKHTEEKLFPCSKCTVKLATVGALKQHEIKHRMAHVWRKCSTCPAFFNIIVGKCRFCKTSE